MAAVCPVMACLASLTRPVAPFPSVRPSCQGPTCVFLFPLPDMMVDAADTVESRLEGVWAPPAGDRRLASTLPLGDIELVTMDIRSGDFRSS